jgi:hypothetical protein
MPRHRYTDEEKSFISNAARDIYLSFERKDGYKGSMYVRFREILSVENTARMASGQPRIVEPSFDTFSRYMTKSVPADQMQGRPRKV